MLFVLLSFSILIPKNDPLCYILILACFLFFFQTFRCILIIFLSFLSFSSFLFLFYCHNSSHTSFLIFSVSLIPSPPPPPTLFHLCAHQVHLLYYLVPFSTLPPPSFHFNPPPNTCAAPHYLFCLLPLPRQYHHQQQHSLCLSFPPPYISFYLHAQMARIRNTKNRESLALGFMYVGLSMFRKRLYRNSFETFPRPYDRKKVDKPVWFH